MKAIDDVKSVLLQLADLEKKQSIKPVANTSSQQKEEVLLLR